MIKNKQKTVEHIDEHAHVAEALKQLFYENNPDSEYINGIKAYRHLRCRKGIKMDTEEEVFEEAYYNMPTRSWGMGTNTKNFDFISGFVDAWKRDKKRIIKAEDKTL